MIKLPNFGLVSTMTFLAVVAVGCAAKNDGGDEENLGTNESLLLEDNEEIADTEQTSDLTDDGLSTGMPEDDGNPGDNANDGELLAKVKSSPGRWFQPAGCIQTTLAGNVATHVFDKCTGPHGLVDFNGTVTSTYVRGAGTLTITHVATGFKANGATLSGTRVVTYTKSGSVVTKHRTGAWTGTTKKGKAFSHDADFTATWDGATKCITRDGSAQTSVASREFSRSITGYRRCGIGLLGCPESGKIVLERTKGANTASLTVEFLGGRDFTVTGPKGNTITRKLLCNPNAG